MAEKSSYLDKKRYAVVTGSNKGIGREVCRQLASQGVVVVLTSRNEKRGIEALDKLQKSGISSENLEFHQLDVTDSTSVASLADFIKAKFGKLDILVNNAAIGGAVVDFGAYAAAGFPAPKGIYADLVKHTYELSEECFETNYYGPKRNVEALLPLLELSDSPRIINVSSGVGKLNKMPKEHIREVLGNVESLTEEKVEDVLNEFLRDFKEGLYEKKNWPSAYATSKAALNAYTRIIARKYPFISVNCLCPGFVKTDINGNTGYLTVEEGASRVVRLALMPYGSPSGLFYMNNQVSTFE